MKPIRPALPLVLAIFFSTELAVPNRASAASNKTHADRVTKLVEDLGYSKQVAADFLDMVNEWKTDEGKRVSVEWEKALADARDQRAAGALPLEKLAETELEVVSQMAETMRAGIAYHWKDSYSHLPDVIQHRKARSLGYAQVIYVLGNALGLKVEAIAVSHPIPDRQAVNAGHTACVVVLSDKRIVMVDLTFQNCVSSPFVWGSAYKRAGAFYQLADKSNPHRLHRRVQLLDQNGLLSNIYTSRGDSFSNNEEYEKALPWFEKALVLDPSNPRTYRARAHAYTQLDELDKAAADCRRALELDPEHPGAYIALGYVCWEKKEYEKSFQCSERARKLDPWCAPAYINSGVYYLSVKRDARTAVSYFTKAIQLYSELAVAYRNRGEAYCLAKRYGDALADFDKAIELDPKTAGTFISRGSAHAALGAYQKAIANYTKASQLAPKNPVPYYNRALARYHSAGDLTRERPTILGDLDQSLELDPRFVEAHVLKGVVLMSTGSLEAGLKEFDTALRLRPGCALAYVNRGAVRYKLGAYAQALPDLDKALELDPENLEAHWVRGLAYFELHRYRKALPDLEIAIRGATPQAELFYARGICHAETGDKRRAALDLRKAAVIDRSYEERVDAAVKKYRLTLPQ